MEDYENNTLNFTTDINTNYSEKTEIIFERTSQFYYILITIPLLVFCVFSVLANALILASLRWIRRPLSPTLHISLSLAAADMFASLVIGVGLVVNSLLPQVFRIQIDKCSQLVIEALRMGGMYSSLGHLLTLAVNHYLGIRKPLHYPSIMTTRNITFILMTLWIIPPASFAIYFSLLEQDGFAIIGCDYKFITRAEFRSSCCYIFLVCLITMAVIYSHIYLLVRQHQANRNRFRRVGSSYNRNPASGQANDLRQSRNEKALRTTLLIVGTVVLGWLPATIYFYLVCDNCFIKLNWGTPVLRIITSAFLNFLILLKTALNSCIYAARMHEIKFREIEFMASFNDFYLSYYMRNYLWSSRKLPLSRVRRYGCPMTLNTGCSHLRLHFICKGFKQAAIRLMHDRFIICCNFGNEQNEHNGLNSESSRHFISRASLRPSRGTVLCRLQSIPRNECTPRENAQYTTTNL